MNKKAYLYVDDVIWCLRDIAREHPSSIFDQHFLGVLKTAHDLYNAKFQLNLFYRTDYFYGNDEFSLSDMPDRYKSEWQANANWLTLAFHAKEEFPDYPHVNASYDDVKELFELIKYEVYRFAGEKSFSWTVCPHWLPVSKAGCMALRDCGVKLIDATFGETFEYSGDPASLPYGHSGRLLQNRQPETMLFHRGGRDLSISRSICGYNHLVADTSKDLSTVTFPELGIPFKTYCSFCLNTTPLNEVKNDLDTLACNEYIGICNHEQYSYPDYYAYQPDQPEKIMKMCDTLATNGFKFVTGAELFESLY